MLLNGGFSPLAGFMNKGDYESVCSNMRLSSGVLWRNPDYPRVTQAYAKSLARKPKVALRDAEGGMIAILHVEDIWQPDRQAEGKAASRQPTRRRRCLLMNRSNPWYIGSQLEGLQLPSHDFKALRPTPAEFRADSGNRSRAACWPSCLRNPSRRAPSVALPRRKAGRSQPPHPSGRRYDQARLVDRLTHAHCTSRFEREPARARHGFAVAAQWP